MMNMKQTGVLDIRALLRAADGDEEDWLLRMGECLGRIQAAVALDRQVRRIVGGDPQSGLHLEAAKVASSLWPDLREAAAVLIHYARLLDYTHGGDGLQSV